MKDRLIQKNLELYADSLACHSDILNDALNLMDAMAADGVYLRKRDTSFGEGYNQNNKQKSSDLDLSANKDSYLQGQQGYEPYTQNNRGDSDLNKKRSKRGLAAAITAVAAVLLIIILPTIMLFNFLSNLNDSVVEPSSYSLYSLSRTATTNGEIQAINGVKTLNDTDDYTLEKAHIYKASQNGNVLVVSLIYKAVRDGSIDQIEIISDIGGGLNDYERLAEGAVITNYDDYRNGEYYSFINMRTDGKNYFITITSPNPYAASEYADKINFAPNI